MFKVEHHSHDFAWINDEIIERAPFSSSRRNFVYNGLIFKLERHDQSIGQTEQEIKLWHEFEDEDRQWFVPLIAWHNENSGKSSIPWVVQEYLPELHSWYDDPNDDDLLASQEDIDAIYRIIKKYAIEDVDPEYGGNVGIYNGRIAIYDWGV